MKGLSGSVAFVINEKKQVNESRGQSPRLSVLGLLDLSPRRTAMSLVHSWPSSVYIVSSKRHIDHLLPVGSKCPKPWILTLIVNF